VRQILPGIGEVVSLCGLTQQSVSKARKNLDEVPDINYYLRGLGFQRDKLGDKKFTVKEWLLNNCPFKSGRLLQMTTCNLQ
jgi:hypothetical protein